MNTTVWGYGREQFCFTWPGRTFQVRSYESLEVKWENSWVGCHTILPVRTTLNLGPTSAITPAARCRYQPALGLQPARAMRSIPLKRRRTDRDPPAWWPHAISSSTATPSSSSAPTTVRGPQWVETRSIVYDNNQPAGNLWYHDHALGITRLNVYAGMAGFYFVRDDDDTGLPAIHLICQRTLRDGLCHPGPHVQGQRRTVLPGLSGRSVLR